MHPTTVAETDAFMAGIKKLEGYAPEWIKTGRGWQATWSISDAAGITVGRLHFECDLKLECISISVIFGAAAITRLDIVPIDHWHENRNGARALGLPAIVHGPHIHSWLNNRSWLLRNNTAELPFVSSVDYPLEDFSATFSQLCNDINLTLEPGQRTVSLPRQGDLF